MSDLPVTGEVSNSKLAAVFDRELSARAAVDAVVAGAGLQPSQVKLVTPAEPNPGIKLQPEGGGIWRTIVIAHLRFGVAGLVAGALAWAVLMAMGVTLIVSSAVMSFVAFVFIGAVGRRSEPCGHGAVGAGRGSDAHALKPASACPMMAARGSGDGTFCRT